jgi:hypothetical protein
MADETTSERREIGYRRWMGLARLAQVAPIPIMLGIVVAAYVGWFPTGIENDHIVLLMLGALGVTLTASWMAGRRRDAMLAAWGRRRAERMGFVPSEQKQDNE